MGDEAKALRPKHHAATDPAAYLTRALRCGGVRSGASPVMGSMREKCPSDWELRVFEGAGPLTGMGQYRTRTFRGTKRQAQSALARPWSPR